MKLSVAMCTYNGSDFLSDQLESILEQTVQVNEIIICDDCSTDKTIAIIELFINKYPGVIQLYKNKQPLGTIRNFEKSISLTTGDLIFLADQDDIWQKDKVEIMVNFFNENNNCKLLFTNGELIDEDGSGLNATLWEKWNFSDDMQIKWKNNKNAFQDLIVNNNKITGATVCFNSSLKKYILPIALPYGYWHDCWFGLHAAANGGLMFLDCNLIKYRIHKNQQVGIKRDFEKIILDISNPFPINPNKFYEKIKKKYPRIKRFVPINKNKSIIKRIILKIKKIVKIFL